QVAGDPGVAPEISAHQEILAHGQPVEDPPALGDVGDALEDDLVGWATGQALALEDHATPARGQESRDGLERGGLAGAVVAEGGHDPAAIHAEGHALQSVNLAVIHVEAVNVQQGAPPPAAAPRARPR